MPSIARPPDSTSSVATILASSPGCRYVTPVTSRLNVIERVCPATNPRLV
jgi:hypothetical protein